MFSSTVCGESSRTPGSRSRRCAASATSYPSSVWRRIELRPQSLRSVFLLWLVVPLICLWLASSLAALAVSRHLAGAMYDEELLDTARAIDLYARSKSNSELNENTAGVTALLFDSVDQLRYG